MKRKNEDYLQWRYIVNENSKKRVYCYDRFNLYHEHLQDRRSEREEWRVRETTVIKIKNLCKHRVAWEGIKKNREIFNVNTSTDV